MNYAGQEYPIVVELVGTDGAFEYFKVYNPKSAAYSYQVSAKWISGLYYLHGPVLLKSLH